MNPTIKRLTAFFQSAAEYRLASWWFLEDPRPIYFAAFLSYRTDNRPGGSRGILPLDTMLEDASQRLQWQCLVLSADTVLAQHRKQCADSGNLARLCIFDCTVFGIMPRLSLIACSSSIYPGKGGTDISQFSVGLSAAGSGFSGYISGWRTQPADRFHVSLAAVPPALHVRHW